MAITLGSQIRLTYDVVGSSGALVNPSTASVQIALPDGITVVNASPTLPPTVTGKITYDYTTTQSGHHSVYWATTGPVTTGTTSFNIDPAVSTGLFSLSDAKRFLNEPLSDTSNDAELIDMIFAVTEIVENKVGPCVPRTFVEKVDGGWSLPLRHGPILSVTSVTPWMPGVGGETVPAGAWTINYDAWTLDRNIGFWRGPYRVVYVGGRRTIPYATLMGGKDILDHLWETQRGSSLVGPGVSQDDESFSVQGRTYTVPRAVLEMLTPERIGPQIG